MAPGRRRDRSLPCRSRERPVGLWASAPCPAANRSAYAAVPGAAWSPPSQRWRGPCAAAIGVSCPSLDLYRGGANHLGPFLRVALDQGSVLLAGAGQGFDGLANQLAFHFRQVQDANRLRAQPLDDGWRRLCRRIEAEPQRLLEARDAGLGQRWNVRQRRE